jgi:hypothetical protein
VPVAPCSWRETAAVLALFAMLLSAIAGFLPTPSDAFGIMAGDPAALCTPGGDVPSDHDPGPDRAHHSCPCCLTPQTNWAAIVPASGVPAQPVFVAADAPVGGDLAPPVARLFTESQPRAPPFAA